MGCLNPNIPKYLHFNEKRKIYPTWCFAFWHLIYRIGKSGTDNPIDSNQINSGYSVCWSKLIRHWDVLKTVLAANPSLGNTVYYGKALEFKKVYVESECTDGIYKGKHVIKTKLKHSPEPCNYSHSEVLIEHTYFDSEGIKHIQTIEYADWKSSILASGKPPKFYKELRAGFRAQVFTILNNELKQSQLPFYLKFHPKLFICKILIFLKLQ
jgi:hypothetical protein